MLEIILARELFCYEKFFAALTLTWVTLAGIWVQLKNEKKRIFCYTILCSSDLDLYDPGRSGRYMSAVRKPKHSLQAQPTTAQVNQQTKKEQEH